MTSASAGCSISTWPAPSWRSATRAHVNFQIQITREQTAVPLTRDYITEREREAARRSFAAAAD